MAEKQTKETATLNDVLSIFSEPDTASGRTNMDTRVLDADSKNAQDPVSQDGNNADDNSDIPQDVMDRMNGKSDDTSSQDNIPSGNNVPAGDINTNNNDNEPSVEDVAEAEQVTALFDAIVESLGYNPNDIDGDRKPLTVDDLTTSLGNIVKENSKPQYADERIAKLDDYVKNGGKFEDFYGVQRDSLNLDDIDLDDESNQKEWSESFLSSMVILMIASIRELNDLKMLICCTMKQRMQLIVLRRLRNNRLNSFRKSKRLIVNSRSRTLKSFSQTLELRLIV